jgi:hypothetical protein
MMVVMAVERNAGCEVRSEGNDVHVHTDLDGAAHRRRLDRVDRRRHGTGPDTEHDGRCWTRHGEKRSCKKGVD